MAVPTQPDDAERFLRSRYGTDISDVQRIGHGEWSKAFFFRHAGRDRVVRFSPLNDDFLKDERVLRLAASTLPTPELLEIGEAFDGYFAISERAFGEFLELRDAAAMQRLLPSVFEVLDATRAIDVSETSGFGLWRGADGAAACTTWQDALLNVAPSARTQGWRERLSEFDEPSRVFEAGHRAMASLSAACPNERYLLHSDLLYFNVLVRDDRVTAVLDWGSSMYGDFLWDLAWLTLWQPWYTDWASVDVRGAARRHFDATGVDVPAFAERMRCYELAIGLDGMAYEAWAGHSDNLRWTTSRVRGLLSGADRLSE